MKKSPRRKRVSKAEWLAQALEVLAAEGVQGVRVERLARDLGIAKAGFYWHFRDRRDLMQSISEIKMPNNVKVMTVSCTALR